VYVYRQARKKEKLKDYKYMMPLSMNLCLKSTVWDLGCQFLLEVRGVKGGGRG